MQMETLRGKELKAIADKNDTATRITTALALRNRLRHFSDIGRMKTELKRAGEKIQDNDYNKYWHDLQKAGLGSIIYGRKNVPHRFEWYYNLKLVAQAAIEGKDVTVQVFANKKKKQSKNYILRKNEVNLIKTEEGQRLAPVATLTTPTFNRLIIPYRKGELLDINLPKDLTKDELGVIQSVLDRVFA